MSDSSRKALLELATKHGTFIIEDSPYRRIRFEGTSERQLKGLDTSGTVILVGTFSKLIAPGLRLGWVAASRDIIRRLAQLKSDGGSCPLTQRIIVEFFRSGGFTAHVERVQHTYRMHRDRAVDAIRRELPYAACMVPEGGYYLWITLPDHIDGDELAMQALKEGVTVMAGSAFFAGASGRFPKNHLRLSYSHVSPDQIDEGIRRLGRAYRAYVEHGPFKGRS
jgi:2-aminoadipate transaminase